ncbi:GMC family oxidoreductase [Algicola sagamiensis]|uniref:GMC family oxidoreductase n=1 Tax=Algicola sagamiensis TaxID=163869 RepID=UPI00035F557B|nr:GMC family oxidoreductase [Algicola sagamiensis]
MSTAAGNKHFDYIVVGAGSSGCVMAARLSEDTTKSVLLIEAGPASDVHDPKSPLRDASRLVLEGYNWDYQANLTREDRLTNLYNGPKVDQPNPTGRKLFGYKVGKVVGGSSAVNGAVALRTFPSDFEKWASMGCPQWSWENVLPWFRHLETDVDFPEHPAHGQQGPMRLRRPSDEELHSLDAAFSQACQDEGIPYTDDLNQGEAQGVGLVPANVGDKAERFDVNRSYLEEARERANLALITEGQVAKILFDGKTATGVQIVRENETEEFHSPQVILCAGAIGTAAILQRSGIGDAKHLNALNIPVIADLPAVGKNLMDHVSVVLWALPKAGVCTHGLPWRQVAARIDSGYDNQVDVQIGLLNNMDSATVPSFRDRVAYPMLVGASAMLMRPEVRGNVFIDSQDSQSLAQIDLPLRENEADIARLVGAVRKMWRVLKHPEVSVFLDGVQFWTDAMIDNDVVMHNAIKNLVNPGWHASGTVRMGQPEDPQTAAHQDGRVQGIDGVTVADASLFPAIPSMPTNLTTIMMAEKVANMLIERGNQ